MNPGRRAWLAALATVLLVPRVAVPVAAQDLGDVAPQAVTIEHEDARIRVLRLRVAPQATLPLHQRPARVVVSLTANDALVTDAAGAERRVRTQPGEAGWGEPVSRRLANLAGKPLENVIVEIKDAPAAAVALPAPPSPRPAEYLEEPLHRWAFENQYVRVFDVRVPPGETTAFHYHALDAVYVHLSGGRIAAQVRGEPWAAATDIAAGTVLIAADAQRPFTHRVRNQGSQEVHLIAVQLLR